MNSGPCQTDPRRPSGFAACVRCVLTERLGDEYETGRVNGYDLVLLHDHDADIDGNLMEGDVRAALRLCPRMHQLIGHLAEVHTIPEGFSITTPISLTEIELLRLQIELILRSHLAPINAVDVKVREVQDTVFLLEIAMMSGLPPHLYQDKILSALQADEDFKDLFARMFFQMREGGNGFIVTASLPRS